MNIKEKKEQLGKLHYQMEDAAKRAEKAGEIHNSEEWNKWTDDYQVISKEIEQAEAQRDFLAKNAEKVEEPIKKDAKKNQKEKYNDAFNDFLRHGTDMEPENKQVLRGGAVDDNLEKRTTAQSTTVGKGGYTIPTEMANHIETAETYYGGMLTPGLCTTINTNSGGTLNYPLVDDTSNSGFLLTEATNAETSATDIDFTQGTLNAYKFTSGLVRISSELLYDSAFDIGSWLADQLAIRYNRAKNTDLTTGSGSSRPKGVVDASSAQESLAKRSISLADIRNLLYSIDKVYRNRGTFMFHDSTEKLIMALQQSSTYNENVSLWQPSFKDGLPSTILGKPYIVNNDMAEVPTTGLTAAKVILFGDFSKYVIRNVQPLAVKRFDELFGATDQVAYVLLGRFDGDLMVASTCYPIGHGYMATT